MYNFTIQIISKKSNLKSHENNNKFKFPDNKREKKDI